MGLKPDEIIAGRYQKVAIGTSTEGGINIWNRMLKKLSDLGATTENATIPQIWKVHRTVYEEIGHPEWAKGPA